MYSVSMEKSAEDFYRRAAPTLARKIARALKQLEVAPRRHPNIKHLQGSLAHLWRYRIGDYRIIYVIVEDDRAVVVTEIVHRRDAYE